MSLLPLLSARGQSLARITLMLSLSTASACSPDSQRVHVQEVAAQGGVVDSILSIAEHLRRFRVGLDSTDTLAHASASRDALIERWATAVSHNDSTDLNAMLLTRAEFAWLYYPDSPMSKPPYEAPPELLWGQMLASSNSGATQLVKRFGGSNAQAASLTCTAPPTSVGENRLYEKCEVQLSAQGRETLRGRLFGTIIEHHGRFKFVGLSTAL